MQLVEMQGQMIELQALLLQKIESYYLDTPESTKQEDKFVREILLLEGKANRLKSRIEKEKILTNVQDKNVGVRIYQ